MILKIRRLMCSLLKSGLTGARTTPVPCRNTSYDTKVMITASRQHFTGCTQAHTSLQRPSQKNSPRGHCLSIMMVRLIDAATFSSSKTANWTCRIVPTGSSAMFEGRQGATPCKRRVLCC